MLEKTFNANGKRIKAERKARNLTQQDLAEAVGFNKRTIENAEANKRIKEHFLQKIAKALEISFQDVVIQDHSELSGAVQSNRRVHLRTSDLRCLDSGDGRKPLTC
jgi:transcriptional regulator with XRE-family HTH domain